MSFLFQRRFHSWYTLAWVIDWLLGAVGAVAAEANQPKTLPPDTSAIVAESKAYLKRFIDERLDGNLDALVDFDVATLEGDPVYGNLDGRLYDSDDSDFTRAVFTVVFGDRLPDLVGNLGTGKRWRGDTMNSFHTTFGKPVEGPVPYRGLVSRNPDADFIARVEAFHSLYHSIGNFTPLPNISHEKKTLNTYRAGDWKDYFDRFLIGLRAELMGQGSDPFFSALVWTNGWFFEEYRGGTGFAAFANLSLWNDYLDADGIPVERYPFLFWWDKERTDADAYKAEADRFMEEASRLIRARGRRMVAILKEKL